MATNRVTIPKSYKGLKAVYITPSEEGLLRKTSHPKGSSQPKKGPGGLLMMNGGGEEDRDRTFARKHGLTYKEVTEAGGSTMRATRLTSIKAEKKKAAAKKEPKKSKTPSKDDPGKKPTKTKKKSTKTTTDKKIPVWKKGVRTRMGYDPDGMIDYTNTNPAYWTSVISYYKGNPEGNPNTGELGIWVPNFEKQGAERTALAAIAGGVRAYNDSNYANKTVDEAKAQALHLRRGDIEGSKSLYRGTTEKVIRLAGVHRGGTTIGDLPMGSTDPTKHGVHIIGGKVVKDAGEGYLKAGGDFHGLLSRGDTITGDWLTGVLGAMDKDGMRIGGTYPGVAGATGSDVAAGGTATGIGTFYGGGVDPLASMPKVADYTAYMDPNSIFGGLSKNAAVKSGLLYQPMASDYGAKMEAAGMPAFSPGMLGVGGGATGGVGSVTYGSPASSFTTPKAATATTTTAAPSKYAYPTDRPLYGGGMSKDIPSFASLDALSSRFSDLGSYGKAYPGAKGTAKIGGTLYTFEGGDASPGWTKSGFSYPLVTTTA